jgi:hypothetical protein
VCIKSQGRERPANASAELRGDLGRHEFEVVEVVQVQDL